MKKGKHGRKDVKPDQSKAEPQNSFMVPPPVPGVNAPGQDLGFEGPGAGFAPH